MVAKCRTAAGSRTFARHRAAARRPSSRSASSRMVEVVAQRVGGVVTRARRQCQRLQALARSRQSHPRRGRASCSRRTRTAAGRRRLIQPARGRSGRYPATNRPPGRVAEGVAGNEALDAQLAQRRAQFQAAVVGVDGRGAVAELERASAADSARDGRAVRSRGYSMPGKKRSARQSAPRTQCARCRQRQIGHAQLAAGARIGRGAVMGQAARWHAAQASGRRRIRSAPPRCPAARRAAPCITTRSAARAAMTRWAPSCDTGRDGGLGALQWNSSRPGGRPAWDPVSTRRPGARTAAPALSTRRSRDRARPAG